MDFSQHLIKNNVFFILLMKLSAETLCFIEFCFLNYFVAKTIFFPVFCFLMSQPQNKKLGKTEGPSVESQTKKVTKNEYLYILVPNENCENLSNYITETPRDHLQIQIHFD